jgi:ABC-type phosphate transport system permease subunit
VDVKHFANLLITLTAIIANTEAFTQLGAAAHALFNGAFNLFIGNRVTNAYIHSVYP